MFRIDKTLISYDRTEVAYTNVGTAVRSARMQHENDTAAEDQKKLLKDLEDQLQQKMDETEKTTQTMLREAQERANAVIKKAEDEARGIVEQAEEKGYRDGVQKAQQEMQAQLGKHSEALENLLMKIGDARENMIDELEDEIITLVLETAKKVINLELEKNDKVFVNVVQNALSQIKREGKIVIRVGQDDFANFFSSGTAEFILNNERIKTTVIDEPLFNKGDCVIESEGETVNAGISSQLKYIEFAFRNEESHIA